MRCTIGLEGLRPADVYRLDPRRHPAFDGVAALLEGGALALVTRTRSLLFAHLTPRTLARAPFRVAVSVATCAAILGAGGFMALPTSPEVTPAVADTPAPVASVTLAASAVPIVETASAPIVARTMTHLAAAKPAELTCLAKAVYYEARGESADGQAAVAQVVLNRTHRASYPSNVCGVVFQGVRQGGCQFSFVCNGAMNRPLEPAAWSRARRVAADALSGHVMTAVGQAISFHVASLGSERFGQIARIGSHVFFMPGKGHGVPTYRPIRTLRFAGRTADAPSAAIATTVASAARDAVATAPVVVASNIETSPVAQAQ